MKGSITMARARKPQTLEDSLKHIDLQLRRNEEERNALLEERKKVQTQIELQDFTALRELLSARGMTVHDLLNQMSPAVQPVPEMPETLMTQ